MEKFFVDKKAVKTVISLKKIERFEFENMKYNII